MKFSVISPYRRGAKLKSALAATFVLLQVSGCATPAAEPIAQETSIPVQGLTREQAEVVAKAREAQAAQGYSEREQAAIDLALRTVSEKTPVSQDSVSHLRIRSVEWPDSSLGCPEPGVEYLQRVIPGYLVSFNAEQRLYTVHVGDNQAVVCDRFNDMMAKRQERGRAVITAHRAAKLDLAEKLMVAPEMITVTKIRQETWTDSSLGCPVAGEPYAQGPVDGLIIDMTCRDKQYEYRVVLGTENFVSCEQLVSCHETE